MPRLLAVVLGSLWIAIFTSLLVLSPATHSISSADVPEGAHSIWHFDDETTLDATGTYYAIAHNTRLSNSPFGNAMSFDGTSSYITTTLTFAEWPDFTISLWVNLDAVQYERAVILDNGYDYAERSNFEFSYGEVDGRGYFFWIYAGNRIQVELIHGKWTNLVLAMNRTKGEFSLYRDGVLIKETGIPPEGRIDGTPLTIGKQATANSGYYHGYIDEVIVWDRALSDAEVQSLSRFYVFKRPWP